MKKFIVFLVFLIPLALYGNLYAQDHVWPMIRYNAQNCGQSPFNGPIQQPKIINKIAFGYTGGHVSQVVVPPVISNNGDIYVSCLNDTLYALDKNLNIRWRKYVDTSTGGWGISCPAIGPDGNISIFDYAGNHLLKLDNSSGNIIWETGDLAGYCRGIPIIGNDGTIFLESWVLYAFLNSGAIQWSRPTDNLGNAVSISSSNNAVYAIPHPSVASFNYSNGSEAWFCNFNPPQACPDYIATSFQGIIYGAGDDSLYAISTQGNILWRSLIDTYARPGWIAIDNVKNNLFVVGANGKLYAFSTSGQKLWSIDCGQNLPDGAPILGNDGIIYLTCQTSSGNYLRAYHPNDGSKLWEISGTTEEGGDGWEPESQPVIGSDGNIYVGHSRGLYVIGTQMVKVEPPSFSNNPTTFHLFQNYPNPFNPRTIFRYSIPEHAKVTIKLFDLRGIEAAILIDDEKTAGIYELTWDAVNIPSGIYYYQLKSGSFIATKKMVLLR